MDEEELVEEEQAEIEPQITSSDPEERKLARALRIQRRIETIKKAHVSEGVESVPEDDKSLLEKQIECSSELLHQLLAEGEEVVTNVRIGNEARETNRREKETAHRAELLLKLENEASEAELRYEAISRKWDSLAKYKDPLDINDSILSQKGKCDILIKQKDEIIAMLKDEINIAEKRFTADQDMQTDDIATLVRRIDTQIDAMKRNYRTELRLIEETVALERKLLIEANAKKWDFLQKQRNDEEESNMSKRIQLADEFLESAHKTRVDHEEKFRETKIFLEGESEGLQKELETLKAACLLNGEKLDYNYQILKKREEENIIIRSQQKRLINKLQDEINLIKKRIRENRTEAEETIAKRTMEIKKMRDNVFAVEAKTLQITQVNDKTYQQVWALNEEIVQSLTRKIYTTDKIIYEQLLGQEWKHPKKKFIQKTKLQSYANGLRVMELQNNPEKFKPVDINPFEDSQVPPSLIKSILKQVANRSSFLIEQRLNEIFPQFTANDVQLIKIDNVFDVLGIKKSEEFDVLIKYFLPYLRCPICEELIDKTDLKRSSVPDSIHEGLVSESESWRNFEANKKSVLPDISYAVNEAPSQVMELIDSELQMSKEETHSDGDITEMFSESSQEEISVYSQSQVGSTAILHMAKAQGKNIQCDAKHPVYVEPSCVYKTLKEFITDNQEPEPKLETPKPVKQNTLSRSLSKEDVHLFWGQYSHIFSKSNDDIWNGLLFGLKKYYAILRARHNVIDKLNKLSKENRELKYLVVNCPLSSVKKSKIIEKIKQKRLTAMKAKKSGMMNKDQFYLPKI